jgi:hypothetical protein
LLVCVIVTGAVFFKFGSQRHKRVSKPAKAGSAARVRIQRVATPVDQGAGNSIVF